MAFFDGFFSVLSDNAGAIIGAGVGATAGALVQDKFFGGSDGYTPSSAPLAQPGTISIHIPGMENMTQDQLNELTANINKAFANGLD